MDVLIDDRRIMEAVSRAVAVRGPLEQTKGMLMLIYGVDADGAYELLQAQAHKAGRSIDAVAAQFRRDVAVGNYRQLRGSMPEQEVFDYMLRTVHERIPDQDQSIGRGPTRARSWR